MSQREHFSSLPYKLIKRRWWIITPIVMVMSLVYSYTQSVDLYRSSAIVTFQTEYVLADRDQSLRNLFEEKVSSVVGSLRFGDSMRKIVLSAWPDIDPESNPVAFNGKVASLGSRNGVELAFRRDNYRALTISYTSKDPDEAYRVVQSTVDTLIDQTKSLSERRVANSEIFLVKEISEYKRKLVEIGQEITRLENGLGQYAGEDAEVGEQSGAVLTDAGAIREQLRYREGLPQLEFDLKVAEKELARMINKLESGSYLTDARDLEGLLSVGDDDLLRELRSTIIEKQKQRHLYSSQGFLAKHPKQKALDAEIRNLKRLEKERIETLADEAGIRGTEIARLKLERELRSKISEKTEDISRLRDRIAVTKRYREEIRKDKDALVSQIDVIAAQRSRLEQLRQQKAVTAEGYANAVSELEIIRRQGRADEGDIGLRIDIAEAPVVPKYPVPLAHMSAVLMGFAFSVAIGIGLVFLLELIDTSVSSAAELRRLVSIPVIGETDRMVTAEIRARAQMRHAVLIVFLAFFVLASDEIVSRFFL